MCLLNIRDIYFCVLHRLSKFHDYTFDVACRQNEQKGLILIYSVSLEFYVILYIYSKNFILSVPS